MNMHTSHMDDRVDGRLAGRTIVRMNGIGNVIDVLDLRGEDIVLSAAEARAICAVDRLAFDQLMTIHDADEPGIDAHLRIYNADGSRSGACGNGTRCVAWLMLRGTDRDALTLTTGAARVSCRRAGPNAFTVDMGEPRFAWNEIPLRDDLDPRALAFGPPATGPAFALSMGNPHAVFFVPDADAIDLPTIGAMVETAPIFPEGVNVSFAQIVDRGTIKLRVWERGAGATLACGTGACATLVAAAATGRSGRTAHVDLPGGRLEIAWQENNHVLMTGPVQFEFEAKLGADFAANRTA
jgi:diaminopimelate epimerase